MLAYILLTLGSNKEQEVYDAMKKLPEIKTLHILFGEWDIIGLLELKSPEQLGTFVMENIRTLSGVKLSSTMIVAQ